MIDPIVIAAYNPTWPVRYEAERAAIVAAIGPALTAIEHVGSTSVPGLAAKPIIDILAGLRTLADAPATIEPLAALGYVYVPAYEDELPERRYFRRRGAAPVHLHMVVEGGSFWQRHLQFRDYLRRHPASAAAYATLKRDLALRYAGDPPGYTDAKTAFVREIEARAAAEFGR